MLLHLRVRPERMGRLDDHPFGVDRLRVYISSLLNELLFVKLLYYIQYSTLGFTYPVDNYFLRIFLRGCSKHFTHTRLGFPKILLKH